MMHAVDIHTLLLHMGQGNPNFVRPGLPLKKLDGMNGEALWKAIGTIKLSKVGYQKTCIYGLKEQLWGYQIYIAHLLYPNISSFNLPTTCASYIAGVRRE